MAGERTPRDLTSAVNLTEIQKLKRTTGGGVMNSILEKHSPELQYWEYLQSKKPQPQSVSHFHFWFQFVSEVIMATLNPES
ncbi:UNVERIFIED_CONTAM: hypothetical protein FKN15_008725 [Acipenser sinensis]